MGTNVQQRGDGGMAFVDDATSSEFFKIGGMSRPLKSGKVAMLGTASIASGGLFSWVNPENVAIIIDRIEIDITTASAGAANATFGTAANAATASANLIDTYALATGVAVINNIDNKGANGKSVQKLPVGQYLTGTGSASSAGLVASVYIQYYLA